MSKEGIVNIHGKEYRTVAYRVNDFRKAFADYTISTSIEEINDDVVIMRAVILNTEGRIIATGHAEEYRASSQINKTSALENCETSAIGRALACFGVGGTEFASANEVLNAIAQQEVAYTPQQKNTFDALLDEDDDLAFWLFVQDLSNETQLALHSSFNRGSITKMKKKSHDKEAKGSVLFVELRDAMSDYIEKSDHAGLEEISLELGKEGKALAFHQLPANIQQLAREMK